MSLASPSAASARTRRRPAAPVKPRLRGVSHQYAFFAALGAGAAAIALAPTGGARLAVAVYAASLWGLFGASALYHRLAWRPRPRLWMRRLDHSMIFVLIAGTYTPIALLMLTGTIGVVVPIVVWAGALAGVLVTVAWPHAPPWLSSLIYVALGWAGLASFPQILDHDGAVALALIVGGGVLYTLGAIVYARKRPDPWPAVFGYHEIFHVFVIAAAVTHYVAIVLYALPARTA